MTNASTTRNNFTGWVGGTFIVGASPITVNGLARWKHSGNSSTRTVKITTATGTLVATVDINLASHDAGDWAAEAITPVVLSASTKYILQSYETSGSDIWYDNHYPTADAIASLDRSHYAVSPSNTYAETYAAVNGFYVGLNFYFE